MGGIILFGRNVSDAAQLTALTNALKEGNTGPVPLFLAVDEEGGTVSRMPPKVADLPSAYDDIQAGGDPYARGEALAAQCAAFGFNVNFAPVLDIWSNPANAVIGKRAFGTDAETVAVAGQRVADRLSAGGVIPVGKHFPGHGDTATDSHVGLPVVGKTLEELLTFELYPYQYAFGDHLPAVMVGHILVTELDSQRPASLSPAVVDGLLRDTMGFDGLVFTDDLTMGAITQQYGIGEAAVLAIEAGCDVALVCHGLDNCQAAYTALLEAVETGRISQSRLDERVERILRAKAAYAISDTPVEEPDLDVLNEQIRDHLSSSEKAGSPKGTEGGNV